MSTLDDVFLFICLSSYAYLGYPMLAYTKDTVARNAQKNNWENMQYTVGWIVFHHRRIIYLKTQRYMNITTWSIWRRRGNIVLCGSLQTQGHYTLQKLITSSANCLRHFFKARDTFSGSHNWVTLWRRRGIPTQCFDMLASW